MRKSNLSYKTIGGWYVSIVILAFAMLFSSCEGFMNANETKNQIEDAITYANAPFYSIKVVDSKNHGSIVKPAAGETSKKVTDVFEIRFQTGTDYEFIKWEASSPKLPQGQNIYDYISFEDEKAYETKVRFLKALEDIVITPVTVERAQFISWSPMTTGVIKNSTIVVLFDHDMDEGSIYYSKDEVDKLKKDFSLEDKDFLPEGAVPGQTKIYGYKKGGETFYKNVSLVNNKTGVNIAHLFDPPVFENKRTMVITTKDKINGIDNFTQVLVTIEKGIFYEFDGKAIEMPGLKRWMYQVSTRTDNEALGFQKEGGNDLFSCKLEGKELEGQTSMPAVKNLSYPKIINNKITLSLDVMLQEGSGGTGPASNFTVNYERVKDSSYTNAGAAVKGSFALEYDNYTSDEALFNDDFEVNLPEEGVYRIWFDFPDRSNNHFYWPAGSGTENSTEGFYISKDTTPVAKPSSVTISSDKSTTYKMSWADSSAADYKEAIISTGKGEPVTIQKGIKTVDLQNITSGNSYTVSIVFKDYAGNSSEAYVVPKFLTGAVCTGNIVSEIPGFNFIAQNKTYGEYGLARTLYYSDGSSKPTPPATPVSTTIKTTKGPITYSEGYITKDLGLGNDYFVAANDLQLTQTLVKMPDGYTGSLGEQTSTRRYYKFGDYPQSLAANQNTSYYSSSPVYNYWYLGNDGYFYAKQGSKFFKVEPIVWCNLPKSMYYNQSDVNPTNTVLLAEKILSVQKWDSSSNVYKDSEIHKFLNNSFLNTAFTGNAQSKMLEATVTNVSSPVSNGGSGGENTSDKVFLLSMYDATKNLTLQASEFQRPHDSRKRVQTDYSKEINEEYNNWWLRTPSSTAGKVFYVRNDGTICTKDGASRPRYEGIEKSCTSTCGVLPAICIETSDLP